MIDRILLNIPVISDIPVIPVTLYISGISDILYIPVILYISGISVYTSNTIIC